MFRFVADTDLFEFLYKKYTGMARYDPRVSIAYMQDSSKYSSRVGLTSRILNKVTFKWANN